MKKTARSRSPCSRCSQSAGGACAQDKDKPRRTSRAAEAAAPRRPRHAAAAPNGRRADGDAKPAPTPNKGDVAWMLTSHRARADDERAGAGAVLRRHGAREEHAVGADAGVRDVLAGHGAVVHLRLQPRVHRGQRVLRRLRPAVPERARSTPPRASSRWRRRSRKGVVDPRARVRRVPGDLRRDHLLPDPRRVRRAHQVLGGAGLHGALVHLRLRADRAHGVVLDGPGRLHRSEARRRAERARPA